MHTSTLFRHDIGCLSKNKDLLPKLVRKECTAGMDHHGAVESILRIIGKRGDEA